MPYPSYSITQYGLFHYGAMAMDFPFQRFVFKIPTDCFSQFWRHKQTHYSLTHHTMTHPWQTYSMLPDKFTHHNYSNSCPILRPSTSYFTSFNFMIWSLSIEVSKMHNAHARVSLRAHLIFTPFFQLKTPYSNFHRTINNSYLAWSTHRWGSIPKT